MKRVFYYLLLLPAIIFASCNDDDNSHAIELSDTVKSFIETKYPGAVITETEWAGNGLIEVDITHDAKRKEVYFTRTDEWVRTEWDVAPSALAQEVKNAIATAYPDYVIDDVDYVEAPAGDYYEVNIEKGNFEKYLKVSLDGAVIEEL